MIETNDVMRKKEIASEELISKAKRLGFNRMNYQEPERVICEDGNERLFYAPVTVYDIHNWLLTEKDIILTVFPYISNNLTLNNAWNAAELGRWIYVVHDKEGKLLITANDIPVSKKGSFDYIAALKNALELYLKKM